MHILVTGGAGFIGSHTVDLLLQKGHRVRILDSLAPPVHIKGQLPSYIPNEAEFIHGDVRDRAAWETALEGIDVVFHLAAYQDYLPDFSKFFHVNAVGTALLYEIIVANKLQDRFGLVGDVLDGMQRLKDAFIACFRRSFLLA